MPKTVYNPFQSEELQLLPSAGESSYFVDTKDNILTSTPTSGNAGFSSDTFELFIASGTVWKKIPFTLVTDTTAPDMGYLQDSSRIGYGNDYITDKTLSNICLGNHSDVAEDGCIRFNTTLLRFQVYRTGSWRDIVTGLVLREDSTFGYTFEHQPIGFTSYIEIMTGQSLSYLGLNGLPIINAYKVSMGAYPVTGTIGGRTI